LVAEEQTSRVSPTKGCAMAFIESRDGVGLFYRDWGTGSPLVFLAPGAWTPIGGVSNGLFGRSRPALHRL
jgi:hypothetical protein